MTDSMHARPSFPHINTICEGVKGYQKTAGEEFHSAFISWLCPTIYVLEMLLSKAEPFQTCSLKDPVNDHIVLLILICPPRKILEP